MTRPSASAVIDQPPASINTPHRRYIGLLAAAEYTDLSRTYLLSLVHSGRLRAYRVGRRILVDQRDLDDFVTSIPA